MYKTIVIKGGRYYFEIVQMGVGGNGGGLTQRLAKLLYSLKVASPNFSSRYTLADGDRVEAKNLRRQPFIDVDLHQTKVDVLAKRYSGVYDLPIYRHPRYVEDVDTLLKLFVKTNDTEWNPSGGYSTNVIPILIGCVDNHATRQVMHEAFMKMDHAIYIDSGIDAVTEGSDDSGFSGHVVCGYRCDGETILSPVGEVYPEILTDQSSKLPTKSCADIIVNQPQRMQTNEMAATVIMGYLNNILSRGHIVSHYTNFDARLNVARSVFIEE